MPSLPLRRNVPCIVLIAALVGWSVLSLVLVSRLWFFGDDFDFLLNRSVTSRGDRGLLAPHNEHWSTIPILLFRVNFTLFGLHHYMPYALLPLVCHVAITVAVFRLLRRAGTRPKIAAVCAVLQLFIAASAGWENVLWDFQVGFLGSCLSGMVALLVLERDPLAVSRRLGAVLALTVGIMCSGIGLLALFWVGTWLFIHTSARAAVEVVAAPAALFLGWFVAVGHGHHGAPPPDVSVAWRAGLKGVVHVWSAATLTPFAGTAVLVGLVLGLVLGRSSPLFPLAMSGMATFLAAYVLFGYTRSGFGLNAAMESRYVYFGVLFTLPALALGMELAAPVLVAHNRPVMTLLWACCLLVPVTLGSVGLTYRNEVRENVTRTNEPRLVASAALLQRRARILRPGSVPIFNAGITTRALSGSAVQDALPRMHPGKQVTLEVANSLQVVVRKVSVGLPPAVELFWTPDAIASHGARSRHRRSTCETRWAGVRTVVGVPAGSEGVEIRMEVAGSSIKTWLQSSDSSSQPLEWSVPRGRSFFVGSAADGASLEVAVPAGRTTVCTDAAPRADVGRSRPR